MISTALSISESRRQKSGSSSSNETFSSHSETTSRRLDGFMSARWKSKNKILSFAWNSLYTKNYAKSALFFFFSSWFNEFYCIFWPFGTVKIFFIAHNCGLNKFECEIGTHIPEIDFITFCFIMEKNYYYILQYCTLRRFFPWPRGNFNLIKIIESYQDF